MIAMQWNGPSSDKYQIRKQGNDEWTVLSPRKTGRDTIVSFHRTFDEVLAHCNGVDAILREWGWSEE